MLKRIHFGSFNPRRNEKFLENETGQKLAINTPIHGEIVCKANEYAFPFMFGFVEFIPFLMQREKRTGNDDGNEK